ncbi:hypothetical protein MAUB_08870 [Mycolicibacterium aubagnense]|uniref:DUF385 domain-containing protein n=2 Tax=Mycolicibacterium aubagnense TaxID=319707 RepID=A0ABM7I8R9_9MYCO|nr:hypothetical protein MAUB_08870 [Mycolicibacterium aubagnense]
MFIPKSAPGASLAIMSSTFFDNPVTRALNKAAVGLTTVPGLGGIVGRSLVEIRYTGRKSGRSFQTPVNYRLSGEEVIIRVMTPDAKSWWRNFLGDGGPITLLNFRGADRTGHAVATRDDKGRVTVRAKLD